MSDENFANRKQRNVVRVPSSTGKHTADLVLRGARVGFPSLAKTMETFLGLKQS